MRGSRLLFIVALVYLVGCNIFPKRVDVPVYYYDITGPSDGAALNVPLKLSSVDCVFSERMSMMFRDGSNSVRIDDFNKWSYLPSALLRRYFIVFLSDSARMNKESKPKVPVLLLRINVVRFDCDLVKRTANTAILFTVYDSKTSKMIWRRLITAEKKSRTETASGFAAAMSSAIAETASRMVSELNAAKLRTESDK
ncbi:MAG: hypothetical protein GXP32_06850 [Kiritimatiellaeota bacterium]|nr:hypothetical protein [Kiritimatiellota bacterium]